jgi:hypothetical protein
MRCIYAFVIELDTVAVNIGTAVNDKPYSDTFLVETYRAAAHLLKKRGCRSYSRVLLRERHFLADQKIPAYLAITILFALRNMPFSYKFTKYMPF